MVAIKGRVARATGRDRHSKVYTAKGPKDRRVRLSALTAIQFYDVQDRLGYERPSEAVDWLIHKAKASIEALPQRGDVNPFSVEQKHPLQDMEDGVENAAQTSCQENQDLQHFGFDSINGSLGSFSSSYVHMENSMAEFSSTFGNIRSAEYSTFQEESMLCLPPLNQPYFDPVTLNPSDCQKVLSSNHKLSSRTGHQQQACSSIWGEPTFRLPAFPGAALSSRDTTKPLNAMQFPTSK